MVQGEAANLKKDLVEGCLIVIEAMPELKQGGLASIRPFLHNSIHPESEDFRHLQKR
jgi:hypothetical protein